MVGTVDEIENQNYRNLILIFYLIKVHELEGRRFLVMNFFFSWLLSGAFGNKETTEL